MLKTQDFTEAGFSRSKIADWISANYSSQPGYFQEAQQGVVLHFLTTRGSFTGNGATITAQEAQVSN